MYPEDLNLISDFLNSCEHSLNPIRLSRHAKSSLIFLAVWCLMKRSNGIMQIKNNFENAIWQPLLIKVLSHSGNKISSLRKERNVNHVCNDVKIGEH